MTKQERELSRKFPQKHRRRKDRLLLQEWISANIKIQYFILRDLRAPGWTYSDVFLYAENYDGTTVNDAVYERNKRVEDRFSITIEFFCDDDVANDVRKLIMTDDCPYDVVFMPGTKVTSFVQSGYLEDLNTLKYCDFTKNYWDQNCYNTLSLGGKYIIWWAISARPCCRVRGRVF